MNGPRSSGSDTDFFRAVFRESIDTKRAFIDRHASEIARIARHITAKLADGGNILLFGNGGSAADAQHIAAEIVNRLTITRRALPALALTTDSSILTSIANDFSFDTIFSRQVEALGLPGDVALGISTSGNSKNVIAGIEAARNMGMTTVAFLGNAGGRLKSMVDFSLVVPSPSAQRIQEVHITLGHALCEWIEHSLFPESHRDGS